jgi:hypothetical protein
MIKTGVLWKFSNKQNLISTEYPSSSNQICLQIFNLLKEDNFEEKATQLIKYGLNNKFYNEDLNYKGFIFLLVKHLFIQNKIILDETKELLITRLSFYQLHLLLRQYRKNTNVQHDLFTRTIIGIMINGIIQKALHHLHR